MQRAEQPHSQPVDDGVPHVVQPPLEEHHARRGPFAEPLDVLRARLSEGRFRQADDRHRERPLDDHAVQRGPAASVGRRRRSRQGRRRESADLRHADDLGRHVDGHRRDEVLARVARGDRRLHRDLRAGPMDGRRRRRGRLRQEHAGRHDRARADQRAGHLRVRRHDPPRPLERPRPDDRVVVRGGRRVHRRTHVAGGFRRGRKERVPDDGLVRRHVPRTR